MKFSKIILTVFAMVGLTACGGGGGGGGGSSAARSLDVTPENLVGVYDWSDKYDGMLDVYYLVIGGDGNFYEVDYLGDEYDDLSDCYEIYLVGPWSLENNVIVVDYSGDTEHYEVQKLTTKTLELYSFEYDDSEKFPRTDLKLEDLQPVCPS